MSSKISKIISIIQHFKIKYNDKIKIINQPWVLDEIAKNLNIKLNPKLSFDKKLLLLLGAFNTYSKRRQLFEQSIKEKEKDFKLKNVNNAFDLQQNKKSGEKVGVPESQKFIIPPSAFQSNQNRDQLSLFANKEIESLKDLINNTNVELKTEIRLSRPPEVAKFVKKFDEIELKARNQAKEEMTESDYRRFRDQPDDDLYLPQNYENLSPIVQGWIKWTREDIDDIEFFDEFDDSGDAKLPNQFNDIEDEDEDEDIEDVDIEDDDIEDDDDSVWTDITPIPIPRYIENPLGNKKRVNISKLLFPRPIENHLNLNDSVWTDSVWTDVNPDPDVNENENENDY